ncbi:hypothetical protein RKD27_008419 [Streptomyces sp. SAI-126]|uniref:universal stress protein n=1 Tax=unclassified Streptomyces TaxID=2593676 RepID=UPI0036EFAB3B
MSGPVIAGADGSPSGPAAVAAAERQAERPGTRLTPTRALTRPPAHLPPEVPPRDQDVATARAGPNGPPTEAERAARRIAPGPAVTRDVLIGEPPSVLDSPSGTASPTVVGSSRATPLRGRLRALVAGHLTARGRGPLLVVRGRPRPDGPVVLGDDMSQEAAGLTLPQAAGRGTCPAVPHRPLSASRKKHPGVIGHIRPGCIRTGRALLEAGATAPLAVIGARHRSTDPLPVRAARKARPWTA